MTKFADALDKIYFLLSSIFNIELLFGGLFPGLDNKIVASLFKGNAYGNETAWLTFFSFFVVICYLLLCTINRKKAFQFSRILILVLPAIFVLAAISDMISFNLSFEELFSPSQPLLHRLQ
jgi:hypothetical protein